MQNKKPSYHAQDRRLSLKDFAAFAGVHVDTVRTWIRAGYIKGSRNPRNARAKDGSQGWSRLFVWESELNKLRSRKRIPIHEGEIPPLPLRERVSPLIKAMRASLPDDWLEDLKD